MSKKDNRICLGAIVGVHGVRGEVKVKSFTEVPEDIDQYGLVENKEGSRKFEIKVVGHSKDLLRVKIKGLDDRNEALALKGTGFYVSKDVLPALEEEEFYHADLIGLKVQDETSEVLGEVVGVYNFGAGDMLEIKLSENGKSEMLPFTKEYVPTINIKDGYIIVRSLINFAEEDEEDTSFEDEDNEG